LVDSKASPNAIWSFGAIRVEEEGVRGGRWGGPKVRESGDERVLGLKGGGDPVKVVKIKIEAQSQLFDLEEVTPKSTPAQIIPDWELGFDSKVGSNGEFIDGDGERGNVR
jgi:hypothetical protein